MACQIAALRPIEQIIQDSGPVAAIYRDMGTVAPERLVSRALGELTLVMSRLATRVGADDLDEAPRLLRLYGLMLPQGAGGELRWLGAHQLPAHPPLFVGEV